MRMLFLLLLIISCGKESPKKSSVQKQNVSAYYSSPTLKIKVFYEPGAEPYVSDTLLFKYWTILEKNLEALFQGRKITPQLTVPKELSDMQLLPISGKDLWTVDDVMKLSQAQNLSSLADTFEIYFVNGNAEQGPGVIGFHVSNTRVMVIFKDVIRSTGTGQGEAVPKYVEQSTLVHELGHTLGLVNNGLPMKHEHQDKAHGAHCSNEDCVMYWSNEGTAGLIKFAQRVSTALSVVMFDDKCLEDARSF
jgi:predicted Zn-dependent protease